MKKISSIAILGIMILASCQKDFLDNRPQ
ncbi:MAG: hypothetical protein RIS13_792, partial [Bacteroidota bacterium]